ncbi:MAG TPA: carbohydrate-binding protein [Streptomyces sp.]|nr:carbohydrate-binding protein [Streptomyces sp.]
MAALGALLLSQSAAAVAAEPPPRPLPGPLPGAAQTLGAEEPSAEVLRALQRDLGLTPDQAKRRLVNEAEAGTRAGLLRDALGKRFAGAWVTGTTSGRLNVATTRAGDAAAIQARGARAVVVKNSLASLRAAKGKLDAVARREGAGAASLWYVDVPANRVAVAATTKTAGASFVKAAGLKSANVTVRVSENRPRLLQNLTGGDAYFIDAKWRCSVGFSVTRGDRQGFATAGHCGEPGARTTGYDDTDQGVFEASEFPGRDMAWVGVDDGWTATPEVRAGGNRRVLVTGSVEALVGASVCRSGSSSGWHCGRVVRRDTSVSYEEGTVDGLTQTTVCAEPGDSGGPFVAGTQAQGVTSGGAGDCTSGGTTFFQPLNPLLARFGLTLTTATATASGQAVRPVPQGGAGARSWAAGRVYEAGATVTHGGVRYRCLQGHQSQAAWAPARTPALWQRA